LPRGTDIPVAGNVALRVVAGTPMTAGLLRTDQLISALARRSLWLTDAYFVGVTPYVQALLAAARDGADVRLLVPRSSDLPVVRSLSRSGFRPLLEGGIRIFEWNGSMLHAKTAVVDGRWSRIGSSNLNLASLLGNYELDVAIDSRAVAAEMERMYLADLTNATEVVLSHDRVRGIGDSLTARKRRTKRGHRRDGAAGSVAAAGAIRVANAVGAAMANRRLLGPAEVGLLLGSGATLLALAVVAMLWPVLLALPVAVVAGYVGLALLWRAHRLRSQVRRARKFAALGARVARREP
jgi:cardiolipin synthase